MQPIKIILSIALFTLCTACGSEMDMELEGIHSAQQEEVRAAKVYAKKKKPSKAIPGTDDSCARLENKLHEKSSNAAYEVNISSDEFEELLLCKEDGSGETLQSDSKPNNGPVEGKKKCPSSGYDTESPGGTLCCKMYSDCCGTCKKKSEVGVER